MKNEKSTFYPEFFKDQEKMFENFKIFGKMTTFDWLKINLFKIEK